MISIVLGILVGVNISHLVLVCIALITNDVQQHFIAGHMGHPYSYLFFQERSAQLFSPYLVVQHLVSRTGC